MLGGVAGRRFDSDLGVESFAFRPAPIHALGWFSVR